MKEQRASWLKAFGLIAMILGGLWLLSAVVLIVVIFGGGSRAGESVAERIRTAGSPLVREVVFRPEHLPDPPEVNVWLKPSVSESDAVGLWCHVIIPAGGTAAGDTAVVIWNDPGTAIMAANAKCE